MISNFVKEEGILNVLGFDYTIESILGCLDSNENLIINNCSGDYLLDIFQGILYNRLFNQKQLLILSDEYINKIKCTDIIKNLDKRIIYLEEGINFEDSLKEQLLSLPEATGKTVISKVEVLSRSIDKKKDKLLDIINFFTLESNKSLSLIEKYRITRKKLSKYDPLYKYYNIYRIKKPLEKYSYFEVNDYVDKIINSDIIKKYIKYRRFIDNNMFKKLKEPTNYEKLKLGIYKIDELIKESKFQVPLIRSQYTEDFIETFSVNPNMENDDLKNLVNIVNFKYNYNLLKHQKKSKFLGIFSKKKDTSEYENNLNKFLSIEEEITKEYSDNLKNLNSYINKLEFLKSILKEEEYNKLFISLINGEDLKEDLLVYKKIFNISNEIIDTVNLINELESIELEILNYCYNNIEDKKDMEDIIKSIPKLKLYLEIEDQEYKSPSVLEKYRDFDMLLKDLYTDIMIRNNLIPESINSIWDNKLRERFKVLKANIEKVDLSDKEIINDLFPCVIYKLSDLGAMSIKEKNITFDKVIVIDEKENIDSSKLEVIKSLSKNIIVLCKDKIYDSIEFKEYKNLDVLEIRKSVNSNSSTEDVIINEIQKYLEGLGYIIEKNVCIDEFNIKLLIKDNNLNTIAALEIDSESININTACKLKDIYLNKILKDKDIKLYRVWSRDWWINKSRELLRIEEFLKIK